MPPDSSNYPASQSAGSRSSTLANDLPSDILYDLFRDLHAQDPTQSPLTLSHVCRPWRTLALEASLLWTVIVFAEHPAKWDKHAAWIERSRDAPLEITFEKTFFRESSIKKLRGVLNLILPHVRRWKAVSFHQWIHHKIFRIVFDRLRDVPLPQLEKIHIQRLNNDPFCTKWKFLHFLACAPVLQHLSITIPALTTALLYRTLAQLNSPSLRTLAITTTMDDGLREYATVTQLRELLDRLPSLEAFTFQPSGYISRARTYAPPDTFVQRTGHHNRIVRFGYLLDWIMDELLWVVQFSALQHLPTSYNLPITWLGWMAREKPFSHLKSLSLRVAADLSYSGGRWSPPTSSHADTDHALAYLNQALLGMKELEEMSLYFITLAGTSWTLALATQCPRLSRLRFYYCAELTVVALRSIVEARLKASGVRPLLGIVVRTQTGETWLNASPEATAWLKMQLSEFDVGTS